MKPPRRAQHGAREAMTICCRYTSYHPGYAARLALILEACHGGVEEPWATRLYRGVDVERLVKSLEHSGAAHTVLTVGEGLVAGFAYCSKRGVEAEAGLCIPPLSPRYMGLEALKALLAWIKDRCSRGIVEISAGFEHGYLHSMLEELLGPGFSLHKATLMEHTGRIRRRRVTGYRFRPGCVYREAEEIARVYNRAYSKYPWFRPLSVEEVVEAFAGRTSTVLYVAEREGGGVVGFAYAHLFRAVDGKKTAILSAFAVDPEHQGRGVGSGLLASLFQSLPRRTRVAVISAPGLENVYARKGFTVKRRWVSLRVPASHLPRGSCSVSG